jgi:hypothetical protein
MDFDQWRIGNTYAPSELTQIIQDAIKEYQTCLMYNSKKAPKIQKANANSEICSLEEFVNKKYYSLELEFMRHSPASGKQDLVYLWLKFSLVKMHYKLNAYCKSSGNRNCLREKPPVWGMSLEETDSMETENFE